MNLTPHLNSDDKINKTQSELLEQKQKEYKHIGQLQKVPGHTLFWFNHETKEIGRATYDRKCMWNFDGSVTYQERVNILPNCYYEQALNEKNFIKRLKRHGKL